MELPGSPRRETQLSGRTTSGFFVDAKFRVLAAVLILGVGLLVHNSQSRTAVTVYESVPESRPLLRGKIQELAESDRAPTAAASLNNSSDQVIPNLVCIWSPPDR